MSMLDVSTDFFDTSIFHWNNSCNLRNPKSTYCESALGKVLPGICIILLVTLLAKIS